MLPLINGIVLDVIVVVILLSIIALGAFKGIKHIVINFVLFVLSLAVSLTPYTNVLKSTIIQLISPLIKFNAAVAAEHKLALNISYTFLASLILTLLLYVVLRILKALFSLIIKRSNKKNNVLVSPVNSTSRIAGAMFSLVFNGVLALMFLSVFSTPFIGGDKTVELTYVTKHVNKLTDSVLDSVSKDALLKEKVMVRLVRGDVLYKATEDDAIAFKSISNSVANTSVIPSNLDNPQEDLNELAKLLSFAVTHMIDDKGQEVDGYELAVESIRDLANKSVNAFNTLKDKGPLISVEGTKAVSNDLKKLSLHETAKIFEDVFEQR